MVNRKLALGFWTAAFYVVGLLILGYLTVLRFLSDHPTLLPGTTRLIVSTVVGLALGLLGLLAMGKMKAEKRRRDSEARSAVEKATSTREAAPPLGRSVPFGRNAEGAYPMMTGTRKPSSLGFWAAAAVVIVLFQAGCLAFLRSIGSPVTFPPQTLVDLLLLTVPALGLVLFALLLLNKMRAVERSRKVEQTTRNEAAPEPRFFGRGETASPVAKYPITPTWVPALAFVFVAGAYIALRFAVGQVLALLFVAGPVIAIGISLNRFTRRPLLRGEYGRALRRLRLIEYVMPTHTVISLRGSALLMAGRPKEAEAAFRLILADDQGGDSVAARAYGLCHLADALIDQGRYGEARQCLEGAIELRTPVGVEYARMAELLLEQGIEPEKALEFTARAGASRSGSSQEFELQKLLGRMSVQTFDEETWASKAWALARLGRRNEAEEAARQALQVANPRSVPMFACVQWRLGMAFLAMERHEEAVDHFRRAHDADPNGKSGHRAAEALAKYSAWGVRR